jgi:hypothetical protein
MKMPPKDYMTVRVEPELRQKIRQIAMEEQRSVSAQMRIMIIKAVKELDDAPRN